MGEINDKEKMYNKERRKERKGLDLCILSYPTHHLPSSPPAPNLSPSVFKYEISSEEP